MKEKDLIIKNLKQQADAIANIFPELVEVVIHDINYLNNSIIYIAGNVTNRRIGGPPTDLLLKSLNEEKDNITDKYNYKTVSNDGKKLKSTTLFIRDSEDNVVFVFCINMDITQILNTSKFLQLLTSDIENEGNDNETFTLSIFGTLDSLFDKTAEKIGKEPATMTKEEKIKFVGELNNYGAFQIKDSINHISMRMNVSKYTIYNYLKEINAKERIQTNYN